MQDLGIGIAGADLLECPVGEVGNLDGAAEFENLGPHLGVRAKGMPAQ